MGRVWSFRRRRVKEDVPTGPRSGLTGPAILRVILRMRPSLATITLILAMLTAAAAAQAQPRKLAAGLRAQVEAGGETTVFVKLRQPPLPRRTGLAARCDAIAATQSRVLSTAPRGSIRVERKLDAVAAFTVTVTPEGLAALEANPDVERVDAMATGSGALRRNLPLIRGDVVHRRGLLGAPTTVAVLDSGAEVTHPDVAGRIVAQECFCFPNCCPDGSAQESGAGSARTLQPHGLHVTGIVASAGIVSAPGTAPLTKVVSVKVLDEENRGFLSDWIAGLDYIIMERPDVQAVNMSLVSDATYTGFCDQPADPNDLNSFVASFAEAFATLREREVLVFAASGNVGENIRISAPACVEDAVAVGGVDPAGVLWRGSNSSTAVDLLAPGVAIQSDGVRGSLLTLSGTSMATGFATGTAALLLAMNPALTADRLEDIMKRTGVPVPGRQGPQVFPRIDVLAAVNEVWRDTQPLLGGGSRGSDCLVSWSFDAAEATTARPIAGATCHDGDPTCDTNATPGRCGFDLRVCFNHPDGRLPECSTTSAIQSYELGKPADDGDAIDAANATALRNALPPAPIAGVDQCSDSVRFTVPVGTRSIRLTARSADGRRDDDRLRLTCLPR